MKIFLKSELFKIVKIKKPTKAKIFCDVKVGDLISFKMLWKESTGLCSSGNLKSLDVEAKIISENGDIKRIILSQNNMFRRLNNFELIEV